MKKFFSIFIGFLFLVLTIAELSVPIGAHAATCSENDYQLYFDVQEPGSGKSIRSVPINGQVLLYLKSSQPTGCNPSFLVMEVRAEFYIDTANGPVKLGAESRGTWPDRDSPHQRWLQWQVGGLKGIDGKPVSVGSKVQFGAIIYSSASFQYKKPSPVVVTITDSSSTTPGAPPAPFINPPAPTQEHQNVVIGKDCAGISDQYKEFTGDEPPALLKNPCASPTGVIINLFTVTRLVFLGGFGVIFIIIGGLRYIMSAGNEEAAAKGKKTVFWVIMGIGAALLSSTLVILVAQLVLGTNK